MTSSRSALEEIKRLVTDAESCAAADRHGLQICTVTWDDCARFNKSCWGPCISDMTLRVEGNNMPVMRPPNFEDMTWDVPLDQFRVAVGNERSHKELRTITLKEYLSNLPDHLTTAGFGTTKSLLKPPVGSKEECAVVSAQSCFLPLDESNEQGDVSFNPCVFTYGNRHGNDPKVLYIVATCHGTSAQLKESSEKDARARGSMLYFNKDGKRCSFNAIRLEEDRRRRGVEQSGEMTRDEAAQNLILVIQVPLKQKEITRSRGLFAVPESAVSGTKSAFSGGKVMLCSHGASKSSFSAEMEMPKCASLPDYDEDFEEASFGIRLESARMSHAIVRVGDEEGEFKELGSHHKLQRDTRYPIRVTMQYYKITPGNINEGHIEQVAKQIHDAKGKGVAFGSLVVSGGHTSRSTDWIANAQVVEHIPSWWETYWATYKDTFACTKEEAAQHLFAGQSYEHYRRGHVWKGMRECSSDIKRHARPILKSQFRSPTRETPIQSSFGCA